MGNSLGLFIVLSIFWGINSASDNVLLLVCGLFSILLVLLLSIRMRLPDEESFPSHLLVKIVPFYLWLLKEIVVGNLYVAKTILSRNKNISPGFVQLDTHFSQPLTEVILANSITLVPGTLSVELKPGQIRVHTLTQALADDLNDGTLTALIKRLDN